ncbi:MAG TPA: nucleotide sugar dehydrogenase [Ktedonobacteraceae bacterium]|nr:nucleotide sugar dehydrogenase [Ktedonobacteraceae bacterium]
MATICVIGTGYVGLVTGTCLADMGNQVTCVDIVPEKIDNLKRGMLPIYEPGLEELVERNVNAGRLRFTTSYSEGLDNSEFIFIAVNTPTGTSQGGADMRYVESAARSIAEELDHYTIVINKSTVPVGSGDVVSRVIRSNLKRPNASFSLVSNPEFLREGSAILDFQHPDRIVLGSSDSEAAHKVAKLYLPLRAPFVITDLYTAEMIKYASNAFLATKISFINEIAQICERLGADVKEVAVGMGFDKRIGHAFLDAGVGYGGSCFEADETVFTLNSPNVAAERFDTLFAKGERPFQGDVVELVQPQQQRVLAFDLVEGRPTLADVKAITRRPYKGKMVKINTTMGRMLRVTADHPVILYKDQQCRILPAAAVVPGDQLMALCELPTVEQAATLNLIELLQGTALEADVYVKPIDNSFSEQYAQFAAAIPKEMLKYPHEIKRHNRMSLRLFRYLSQHGVLNVSAEKLRLYTAKGAATMINAVLPVDADLLRLCGYYLAEGYLSQDRRRADALRERVGFCFHEQEAEYIADVQRILQRWGLKFIERRATSALTTIVSSRIFAWLLRDVLRCGTRSEDKALPRLVFNVQPELRLELLRGAFSGDGAVTTVQDGQNLMLEYATVSKSLADGMTLLLQTIGVVPSIRTRWMNKSKRETYILRVSGYQQISVLKEVFGDKRLAQIERILAEYQRHIRPRGYQRHGAFATLVVREVEHKDVETTVYSMETSTGTLIASSGLISHNCFPKDVRALAYMADEAGLHPQLLSAVMDINHDQRRLIVTKLTNILGSLRNSVIGILGLAFKPDTDDMREAPSIDIIRWVTSQGATVKVYDPVANETGREALTREGVRMDAITFCKNAYEVAQGADAVVVVTHWNEFKSLNMQQIRGDMRRPVLIDGRNIYEPTEMDRHGFIYRGMGRGTSPAPSILPAGDVTTVLREQSALGQPTLGLEEEKE